MKVLDEGPYMNDWSGEQKVGNNLGSDARPSRGYLFLYFRPWRWAGC